MTISGLTAYRAEEADFDKIRLRWTSDTVGVARVDFHDSANTPVTIAPWSRFGQVLDGTTRVIDVDTFADLRYILAVEYNGSGTELARSSEIYVETVAGLPVDTGGSGGGPDVTAPTKPNLGTSVNGSTITVTASGSTDAVGVTQYRFHYDTTNGFTPSGTTAGSGNCIAVQSGAVYNHTGRIAGSHYYRVYAIDAAGNVSIVSDQATASIASTPQNPAVTTSQDLLVRVTAAGAAPGVGPFTYTWTKISGPTIVIMNATSATVSFIRPVPMTTPVVLQVVVTGSDGGSTTQQVTVAADSSVSGISTRRWIGPGATTWGN